MELRQILREASRRVVAELDTGRREAVSGRPDRVARKPLIWSPELDLRLIDASPEELHDIGRELDASTERLLRRRRAVLASINKELTA